MLNARLRYVPKFVLVTFDGGKRGDAASCGWTLSVARDLDKHMCPRWSRIVEVSHLLDTSGILDKDLLDSFVAELCGMCEVVFALASLVFQALGRKFLSMLRARRRSRKEYSKVWHLQEQRFFYRHDPTGERSWQRPNTVGSTDIGIRVIKGTQQIPSLQSHAEDTFQHGPFNGAFKDGAPL